MLETSCNPTNTLHVPAANRGFGLGFGAKHQVKVYTEQGPKTGALLKEVECAQIGAWVKNPDDKRAVTDFIPPETFVPALQNRLLHADTIELVALMPKLLEHLSAEDRALFFGAAVARIPQEMWDEIAQTRPSLAFNPQNPQAYFAPLLDGGTDIRATPEDVTVNGVSMEITATIFPMLFDALEEKDRAGATIAIAQSLQKAGKDKAVFAPLAEINLNRLVVTDAATGACDDVINNGRTLMIRSKQGPKLRFQGDDYMSSNLHFHPLKSVADDGSIVSDVKNLNGARDDKPEFLRYRDAAHEERCRKDPNIDANLNAVGQLHTIYTSQGKRALLLGADVVIGAENPQVGKYIDFLKGKKTSLEIIPNAADSADVAAKAVPAHEIVFDPLACYDKFDTDGLPEAPFMSLHLGGLKVNSAGDIALMDGKSDVFYRGVRVIHLPEPITVSIPQLKALRELQPVLMDIDEATCVHPRQRFQPPQGLRRDVGRDAPSPAIRG